METNPEILIISNEIIDTVMAGPGIRYYEMARVLSGKAAVSLAVPETGKIRSDKFRFVSYAPDNFRVFRKMAEKSDVLIVTPFAIDRFPWLVNLPGRLVVDLYDPFMLENLFYYKNEPMDIQDAYHDRAVSVSNRALSVGDYFICGSERQRDFWLGGLAARNRINPHTFAQDQDLRTLIDVVGIGIPERKLKKKAFLKGIHPGFPASARIVLWGGGIWDWLDPLTLLEAWMLVTPVHPDARLVFLGTRHPNPEVPGHKVVKDLVEKAAEFGVRDKTVFFFEWISYEDREALLAEADIGVVLHPQHIETRFALRTRVLDCIWAGLPIVVSRGDVSSEWVERDNLGCVVENGNPHSVADALNDLLRRPKDANASSFERVRQVFGWQRVMAPLVNYCLDGQKAADGEKKNRKLLSGKRGFLARTRHIFRQGGVYALIKRIGDKLRRYLSEL